MVKTVKIFPVISCVLKVAGELYGQDSLEQKAVQNAWQKVGVL
ncbi:M4 family metallopeptidase [Scytonema sp. NUACC26]